MNLSIAHLQAALHRVADILKTASGTDKYISQPDIQAKLSALDGVERTVVAALYQFLRDNEPHPGGRITWADLERALPFIQDKILAQFRLLPGPLAEETRQAIAGLGASSLELAEALKAYARTVAQPEPHKLAETLGALAKDLEPVGYHSGQYKPFAPVHLPGDISSLTPDAFLQIVSEHYLDFDYRLERFHPAAPDFFLGFAERQQPSRQAQARELINCMQNYLKDISLAVLEKERHDWRPIYVVGRLRGDVVGVRTSVFW